MTFISSFFRHSRSLILATAFWGWRPHTGARRSGRFADLAAPHARRGEYFDQPTVDTSATPPGQPPFNDFFEEFFANAKTRKPQPPQSVVAGFGLCD